MFDGIGLNNEIDIDNLTNNEDISIKPIVKKKINQKSTNNSNLFDEPDYHSDDSISSIKSDYPLKSSIMKNPKSLSRFRNKFSLNSLKQLHSKTSFDLHLKDDTEGQNEYITGNDIVPEIEIIGQELDENNDNIIVISDFPNEKNKITKNKKETNKQQGKSKVKDDTKLNIYKDATILDFDSLDFEDRSKYDTRDFCTYLRDLLVNRHIVLSIFFKKSLYYPANITILKCFTFILFTVTINTVLFSDTDISARNKLDKDPNVSFLIKFFR